MDFQLNRKNSWEKQIPQNKISVSFNRWSSDKEYRKSITELLEVPFPTKVFIRSVKWRGEVPLMARNTAAMPIESLHSRWKEFVSDDRYWDLFDDELVGLARKIFGGIPPVEYYEKYFQEAGDVVPETDEE